MKQTRFASVPQIEMSGMHHVRVHITVKIVFSELGTIILELHSNVCDYLYKQEHIVD